MRLCAGAARRRTVELMNAAPELRVPTTTAQAVDWTIDTWVDLSTLLSGLGRAELEASSAIGSWSLRDLQAHLAANHRWISGQLELLLDGGTPEPQRLYGRATPPDDPRALGDQDARNALDQDLRADWSLAQVQAEGIEMFARFIAAMARLDDADWARNLQMTFDGLQVNLVWTDADVDPANPLIVPCWRMVCGFAWHHYPHHADDVRRALAARGEDLG